MCKELAQYTYVTLFFSSCFIGDSDYQPITQALTFQQTQKLQCVNTTILDDQTLENAEVFFINLATTDLGIVFNISSAAVTIGNDDGMFNEIESIIAIILW